MSVRSTALSISEFSLDSVSYLASWTSLGAQTSIMTANGAGGSERYARSVELKREGSIPFTINLFQPGTVVIESTNLTVTGFTAGAMNLLADWKNFDIAYAAPTQDGSGGRDRDRYPNYTGGCTIGINGTFEIAASETTISAMVAALSNTAADRQLALSMAIGNCTIELPGLLTGCDWKGQAGAINSYDLSFENRGAPTAPTGTSTLISKILLGTGSDSLLTLLIESGNGDFETTEAIVSSLNISVKDGAITTASGVLLPRGAISHTTT